jgi:hypothetical protein
MMTIKVIYDKFEECIEVDINILKAQSKYFESMPIIDNEIIIDLQSILPNTPLKYAIKYFKLLNNKDMMCINDWHLNNYVKTINCYTVSNCTYNYALLDRYYKKSKHTIQIKDYDILKDEFNVENEEYIFLLGTTFDDIIHMYQLNEYFISINFEENVLFNINAFISSFVDMLDVYLSGVKTPIS